MKVEVVQLPRLLQPQHLAERAVVVFDVLRATTSMTAALAAGVAEIRLFGSTEDARAAAGMFTGEKLLCGEQACLPPAGFDLGNSPGAFTSQHAGKTMFMSTTNGTVAMLAARSAPVMLAGCLLNASAVARVLRATNRDVTLLCAGTGGEVAEEDIIGAGAVLDALLRTTTCSTDVIADQARRLFLDSSQQLLDVLSTTAGGRNVIAAGLADDVAFAARVDVSEVVGRVHNGPLRVQIDKS